MKPRQHREFLDGIKGCKFSEAYGFPLEGFIDDMKKILVGVYGTFEKCRGCLARLSDLPRTSFWVPAMCVSNLHF